MMINGEHLIWLQTASKKIYIEICILNGKYFCETEMWGTDKSFLVYSLLLGVYVEATHLLRTLLKGTWKPGL